MAGTTCASQVVVAHWSAGLSRPSPMRQKRTPDSSFPTDSGSTLAIISPPTMLKNVPAAFITAITLLVARVMCP